MKLINLNGLFINFLLVKPIIYLLKLFTLQICSFHVQTTAHVPKSKKMSHLKLFCKKTYLVYISRFNAVFPDEFRNILTFRDRFQIENERIPSILTLEKDLKIKRMFVHALDLSLEG